jgi:hypothetical protein
MCSLASLDASLGPTCLDGNMAIVAEAKNETLLDPGDAQGHYHRRSRQNAQGQSLERADPHGTGLSAVSGDNSTSHGDGRR